MERTSISYFPTGDTAQDSISECIIELTKMQQGIVQCLNRPPGGVALLDKEQQEILRIQFNVVLCLKMLFKETVEGGQNPPPTTSHLPPSASLYDFPTIQTAFSTISKCIQELLQMQQLVDQIDESLPQSGESLDEEQQNVLRIKSSVVSHLETLFKPTKEADNEAFDDEGVVLGKESFGQQEMEAFERLSLHEKKETKGKYLCLSNGYQIWCLDLEHSSCNTDSEHLPIISTLNLLGEKLATSVGLFHLGTDAYLIGGKRFSALFKKGDVRKFAGLGGRNDEVLDLYRELCHKRGSKGSSRFSYKLTLKVDTVTHSKVLTTSEGKIQPLNNPKFWPITEMIGRKLHVIDGFPFYLPYDSHSEEFPFSHEVCEVDDDNRGGSWKNILTGGTTDRIFNHVLVGDRIYAESHEGDARGYFLEFDSKMEQWRRLPIGDPVFVSEAKTVWDILSLGTGRCVGGFEVSSPRGGGEQEHMFVIFAIVEEDYDPEDFSSGAIAVAFLVTLTGQVICYQRVPGFYSKDRLLQPRGMNAATIIHVGERTLCSVVSAARRKDDRNKEHLFINTFSVEMRDCDSVHVRVRDLLAKKASEAEAEAGPGVELEFVRVIVVDRFIYETDLVMWKGSLGRCLGWRACFLTP